MPSSTALLAALFFIAATALGELRIAYPSGGSGCQIIQFPRWSLPSGARARYNYWQNSFDYNALYDFRRVDDSPKDLLLVNVQYPITKFDTITSPDKYWLNLSSKPRVRRATNNAWESAGPLIRILTGEVRGLRGRVNDHPFCDECWFEYRGVKFNKTGKRWADTFAVLSASGTWARLASFTSRVVAPDADLPIQADTYVDLYHIETGKRVVALSGDLTDFNMNLSARNAGYFLEDRFFVAPISDDRRKMVICDLSSLEPK